MTQKLIHHHGGWRRTPAHLRPPTADHSGLKALREVDPRKDMLPVFNQWALGSCTIHADIGAFTYDQILDGSQPEMLCRLQGYWCERQKEGSLGQGDTGAIGSDGYWAAANVGLAPETCWPYDWPGQSQDEAPAESVFDPPELPTDVTEQDYEDYYRLTKPYKSVTPTVEACKAVLSNKQTISFGFTVFPSFESSEVARTGLVPMPDKHEGAIGGHQTLAVGYLADEPHLALVRNSWGDGWGLGGYFFMPWRYMLSKKLAGDWTTIVRSTEK